MRSWWTFAAGARRATVDAPVRVGRCLTGWTMNIDPRLEAEYNARASIPDHPAIFARWAETSAEARRRLGGAVEVRYGSGPLACLDLFPATREAAPLLVFIHGGYWRSLDKRDFSFLAPPLLKAGFAVAMVNYDLCPAVSVTRIVEQSREALRWLHQHAGEFGYDGGSLHLAGHSAGGHLVAMLFATDWAASGSPEVGEAIAGGIALSGLFDLAPLRETSVQQEIRLDQSEVDKLSPARLAPRIAAPLRVAVGALESRAFRDHAELLHQRWPHCAAPVIVPDAHHLSIVDRFADPASGLLAQLAGRPS